MFSVPTPRDLSTRQCVGQWCVNGTLTKCQTKLIGPPKMVKKSSGFHEKYKIFATRKFYRNSSSNFSLPTTGSEKIPIPHSLHLWKCFAKPKRSLHDDFLELISLPSHAFCWRSIDCPLTHHRRENRCNSRISRSRCRKHPGLLSSCKNSWRTILPNIGTVSEKSVRLAS